MLKVSKSSIHSVWIGGLYGDTPLRHFELNCKTWGELFQRAGYEVETDPNRATVCIFIDVNPEQIDELFDQKGACKWILVRNEPKVVWPANYCAKNVIKFDFIIDIGRDPVLSPNSINWPQYFPEVKEIISIERSLTRVAIVCGNHLRLTKGELYSLRRRCIYEIESIDLFGINWTLGLTRRMLMVLFYFRSNFRYKIPIFLGGLRYWFKKYPRPVDSPAVKDSVLIRYRVSLVIENCEDFLTEKLFDSFFSGCIPVYVGPNLKNFNIPSELFIQCQPNIESIERGIRDALTIDYQEWFIAVSSWINDPEVKSLWEANSIYDKIITRITGLLSIVKN